MGFFRIFPEMGRKLTVMNRAWSFSLAASSWRCGNLMKLALVFTFSFSASGWAVGNEKISSFREAKKLASKIHEEHPFTIYCNCRYRGKQIDLASCGYKVHGKNDHRARRLEWEHVVPAENFGKSFVE